MIISASRRCDIPALYPDWLASRIKAGYCLVRNPRNPKQIRNVSLLPSDVDGFVFWTKNALPMLPYLDSFREYPFYFQYTLNGYGRDIEPGIPSLQERIKTLQRLASHIGRERIVWRYDPILITSNYSLQYHIETFSKISEALSGYFDACIISFIDSIQSTSLEALNLRTLLQEEMESIGRGLGEIARENGFGISTCAETIDLLPYGIGHARCIDHARFGLLTGQVLRYRKDPAQRKTCGCTTSVDIGTYNSCNLGCIYCYAKRKGPSHSSSYEPLSEFLC